MGLVDTAPVSSLRVRFSKPVEPLEPVKLHLKRFLLALEFILVFIGMPAFFFYDVLPIPKSPVLIIISLTSLLILLKDSTFKMKNLLYIRTGKKIYRYLVNRFIISAFLLTALTILIVPDMLFSFPRQYPLLFGLGALSYPLLSVLPQEIIYRPFFYHRYKLLFPGKNLLTFANILSFAFVHFVYFNPVAIALTIVGGYFFCKTYLDTRSFLIASIEHSCYGILLFTIGLGPAFFLSG